MATITRTITRKNPNRTFIVVTAELRIDDPRGLSDGFSITGELYEPHGTWSGAARYRNGREADRCGCIHDDIGRYLPKLQPLINVHLADPDGVPVHSLSNGWYFYTGRHVDYELAHYGAAYVERQGTPRRRAARALHIDMDELPRDMDRAEFEVFVESLRPHWAEQARLAREVLLSVPEKVGA